MLPFFILRTFILSSYHSLILSFYITCDMSKAADILKQYWGYDSFRTPQAEIIESVLAGQDTVALLPTGGGKSVCFQVPGMALEGMTLVISPLIALMKDQVDGLRRMGIPAALISSGMPLQEIDRVLQQAMDGAYKFLYVAPERLHSEMFQLRLPRMNVSLLAVDEAHCISQWGYDFRPTYLEIPLIHQLLPRIPTIALTASATKMVQADIIEKLELNQPAVFSKSFRRENLRYFVIKEENVEERILTICSRMQGTGIIYVRTRKLSTTVATLLLKKGFKAAAYHGGMPNSERDRVQKSWIENETRIIVATNAFGMGIDKPDVRFVLHYNLPFDLESYYQEAGRGGRDGKTALAIAFDNPIDIAEAKRWQAQKYPSWEQVQRHYTFLVNHFNLPNKGSVYLRVPFDIKRLAKESGESVLPFYNSVKLLDREGLLKLEEDKDDYGWMMIKARPRDVFSFKENHPEEGEVLDYALRTLGGEVYSVDMRFLPGHWAHRLGIQPEQMQAILGRLVTYKMIRYRPPQGTPMITFFEAKRRLVPQDINWDKYTFLRKQSDFRFQEILHYLHQTAVCRSLIIQHYFGEQAHEPCGKCDVCIGRHKTKVSDNDFQHIKGAVLTAVKSGTMTYREVLQNLGVGTPAQREKVLRYLIDKEIIQATTKGELKLSK